MINKKLSEKNSELEELKKKMANTRSAYKNNYSKNELEDEEYCNNVLPSSCINILQPLWDKIIRLEIEIECLEQLVDEN